MSSSRKASRTSSQAPFDPMMPEPDEGAEALKAEPLRAHTRMPADAAKGRLILLPGPIGNLEDITLRALRVLKESPHILAEDTRSARRLLDHFGISTRAEAHHLHNEHRQTPALVERMLGGQQIVLLSDAGTPGISDPGFFLVRACRQAGVPVECLPGPTAFVPALVSSGIPCDRFVFEGFLPPKKGRNTRLAAIAQERRSVVIYESPHRLLRCLKELAEHCGPDRVAGVFRELSKIHEEHFIGPLHELISDFEQRASIKGEIVLVLSGSEA